MDYFIGCISLINVVNGLNFSREQTVQLRALAEQVEKAAPKPPSMSKPVSPAMEAVRKTYAELSEHLLTGQPVPSELERRVVQARATQAHQVRATLRAKPLGRGGECQDCHVAPSAGALAKGAEPMPFTSETKSLADFGHFLGDYGRTGLPVLKKLAPQVNGILTEPQKCVFNDFACCLIPPSDLRDPMRAGQADSTEKELEILRKARLVPAARWPMARERILIGVGAVTEMHKPGATTQVKSEVCEQVGQMLDKARQLSDSEFELEKADLARQTKRAIQPPAADSPEKAAYFLLFPGAPKVYDRYLERLAKAEAPSPRAQLDRKTEK